MGEINKDVNENEISTSPETTSEVPTKEVTEADHEQLEPEESDNDDNFNDEAVEKTEESGDDEIDDPKADEEIENLNDSEDLETDESSNIPEDVNFDDDPKLDEDLDSESDSEATPMQELSSYMNNHNYGEDDFDEYSQDPEWQRLHEAVFPEWNGRPEIESPNVLEPNYENPQRENFSDMDGYSEGNSPIMKGNNDLEPSKLDNQGAVVNSQADSELTPMQQLSDYMNEHNYGKNDYAEYSQDPEWQKLHSAVYDDNLSETGDTIEDGAYHVVPENQEVLMPEGFIESDSRTDFPGEESQDISDNLISGQELLDRFGIEHHRNGSDYFVKGDHYDKFENDYYSPDDSSYSKYDVPVQRDISPSLIEGIHLGKREVEDPSIFWGQHERGGTAESFQEIASHIPEVRERLAAGDTLDDLAEDDKLSDCASIYFRNMPEVVERDGYYEFDSNGRHRILAARAIGEDIPVKVIGKRT